jgi:hypothetical protein
MRITLLVVGLASFATTASAFSDGADFVDCVVESNIDATTLAATNIRYVNGSKWKMQRIDYQVKFLGRPTGQLSEVFTAKRSTLAMSLGNQVSYIDLNFATFNGARFAPLFAKYYRGNSFIGEQSISPKFIDTKDGTEKPLRMTAIEILRSNLVDESTGRWRFDRVDVTSGPHIISSASMDEARLVVDIQHTANLKKPEMNPLQPDGKMAATLSKNCEEVYLSDDGW